MRLISKSLLLTAVFVSAPAFAQGAAPGAPATSAEDTKARNTDGKPMSVEKKVPVIKNLTELAMGSKEHTTLVKLVKEAGLVDTLKGPGPFTVFAPTDAAFKKIPKKDLDALMKDKEKLKTVLNYHVVGSAVSLADLIKTTSLSTVQGGALDVKVDGKKVWVGKAMVTKADMLATNGVIHSVDNVLMPPMN